MCLSGVSGPEGWNPTMRTLRNITNNSDMQPGNRPAVAHIIQNLAANQTKPVEQTNQSHVQILNSNNPPQFSQSKLPRLPLTAEQQQQLLQQQQSHQAGQQHQQLPQQPTHPMMHLQQQQQQQQMMQLQQQQSQVAQQQGFPQQQQFLQQQQQQQMHQQQIFSQQQLRPQQLLRPGLQQLQQQFQQQQRLQMLQQQQNQQQFHQQHLQQQQHFLQQQHLQQMQKQHLQQQQALQHQNQQVLQQHHQQQTATPLPPQLQQQQQLQQPRISQLFGHEQGQDIPQDGFLLGCVFAIADYPEQMADKQLLATWKRVELTSTRGLKKEHVIQACGGVVDPTLTSRCTHLLCESQVSNMYVQALREGKRCVTAHWLSTVLKKKKMIPPHRTLHLPFAFPPGAKPCSQHILSVTGFVDADRDDLKLMAYLAGARYTGYLCRGNTVLICKEPGGMKYEKAKEWKIPCVNAQWLCDILLGNFEALRQIQHSRYSVYSQPEPLMPNPQLVQNLLAAWRTPVKVTTEALVNLQLLQKQKISDSTNPPSNKKARLEEIQSPNRKLPPESTPRVMLTGFEPLQVQQYTKRLHALGGEVAESSQKATHLLASKVTRTVKFLSAMSVIKHIVTPEWLEESWRNQKFVDEQSYTLRDAEAEVLFSFSLEESLKRAHTAPLFKGKYFYLTPGICPSLSTMKAILESAGGKLLAKQPSYRKIMEHKQNKVLQQTCCGLTHTHHHTHLISSLKRSQDEGLLCLSEQKQHDITNSFSCIFFLVQNLPEIILISCDNDLHLCREYFMKNI
ncbi:hypothetical protein CCH79_00017353, partial [Gambusia affinis]